MVAGQPMGLSLDVWRKDCDDDLIASVDADDVRITPERARRPRSSTARSIEVSATATHGQDPTPGTREHFLHVTQLRRWGTIQNYVELCRTHGYFTPAFYATAAAGRYQ
jgi:hypothetical protein